MQTYTPYKKPSFTHALFGKISTEVDVGRIAESTNVHYKLRVLMKKRINKRMEVVKNYADVDQWINAWTDLGQKMGPANLQAVHGRIVAAEIERVYMFWRFRPGGNRRFYQRFQFL